MSHLNNVAEVPPALAATDFLKFLQPAPAFPKIELMLEMEPIPKPGHLLVYHPLPEFEAMSPDLPPLEPVVPDVPNR